MLPPKGLYIDQGCTKKARGKISHVRYTSGGGNDDVMLYYLDEQINMMHMLM